MSKQRHTPVSVSIGLPACPDCKALRGDPCRTPSNRTRFPHDSRLRVARMDGVKLWFESDDELRTLWAFSGPIVLNPRRSR